MSHGSLPLGMQVARREPTPCYHDAYSVHLTGDFGGKAGKKHCKTTFSPFLGRFFLGKQEDNFPLLGGSFMGYLYW